MAGNRRGRQKAGATRPEVTGTSDPRRARRASHSTARCLQCFPEASGDSASIPKPGTSCPPGPACSRLSSTISAGVRLEYRVISESCISLQFAAAPNPHSSDTMQVRAARCSYPSRTFNPMLGTAYILAPTKEEIRIAVVARRRPHRCVGTVGVIQIARRLIDLLRGRTNRPTPEQRRRAGVLQPVRRTRR